MQGQSSAHKPWDVGNPRWPRDRHTRKAWNEMQAYAHNEHTCPTDKLDMAMDLDKTAKASSDGKAKTQNKGQMGTYGKSHK
jgi:hypothetical protein